MAETLGPPFRGRAELWLPALVALALDAAVWLRAGRSSASARQISACCVAATVILVATAFGPVWWKAAVVVAGGIVMAFGPTQGPEPAAFGAGSGVGALVLAGALMLVTAHGGLSRLLPPVFAAAVGLYVGLPDTEATRAVLIVLGVVVTIGVVAAGVTARRGAGDAAPLASCRGRGSVGTGATLAPPMIGAIVLSSAHDTHALAGGLAIVATLAVWPGVRVARRAPAASPAIHPLALGAGVAVTAFAIARLGVVRATWSQLVLVAVTGLAGLSLWCYGWERRSGSSPAVEVSPSTRADRSSGGPRPPRRSARP